MNEVVKELLEKDGTRYVLYKETWFHIQKFHPEIKEFGILEEVLITQDVIKRSKWDPYGLLYCKKKGKYYKVVVVSTEERRVKNNFNREEDSRR